jgi:Leucine-rich repeat (LRR) protein
MKSKNIFVIFAVIILSVAATMFLTRDKANSPTSGTNQQQGSTAPTNGLVLDYSNKGLTEFPKEVLSKTNAVELNLSGNNLTGALPSEIAKLTKLEILNVSNNNMTGIPAEVGQLSKLRILNYADNQITGLPNELGKLNNLELFDLSGNNASAQDLDGIKQDLPSTTQIIL